jgi:PHD/YefM family antitoxin component YafN of YafNO toxin-antitoxin module
MKDEMSVLEAQKQLKELIDYVHDTGRSVLLTKRGQPHVIMKPIPPKSKASLKSAQSK